MLFERDWLFSWVLQLLWRVGHQQRYCGAQQAHISSDEYEMSEDGFDYGPTSDYYCTYKQEKGEYNEEEQQGV